MYYVYVTLGILIGLASAAFVSQATLGVWMIGAACFLGILGRLAQAERQHSLQLQAMSQSQRGEAASWR